MQIDSAAPTAEVARGAAVSPHILASTSTVNIPEGPHLAMEPLLGEEDDADGEKINNTGLSRKVTYCLQDSPRMDVDKWDAERIQQLRRNLYGDKGRMSSIIDSDEAEISMEEAQPRPGYLQADGSRRQKLKSPILDSIISITHSPQQQGNQNRSLGLHDRSSSQNHPGASSPSMEESHPHPGCLRRDDIGRRLMRSPSLDSIISTTHSLQRQDDQDRMIGSDGRFSFQRHREFSYQRRGMFDAGDLVSDDEGNQHSASADTRRDRLISEDDDDFCPAFPRRAASVKDSHGVLRATKETYSTPVLERESIIDEETADLPLYRTGQRSIERDAPLPMSAGTSGIGHQRFQPNSGGYRHTFSIIDSSDEEHGRFDREEGDVTGQAMRRFDMLVNSPPEQRPDPWMASTAPATTSTRSVLARTTHHGMMHAWPSRGVTRRPAEESSEYDGGKRNSFDTMISE
jgi:hypothetical protein